MNNYDDSIGLSLSKAIVQFLFLNLELNLIIQRNRHKAKSNSETAYSGTSGKYFYIRIPETQIMGWFQQLVANDESEPYKALSGDIYSDMIKELR